MGGDGGSGKRENLYALVHEHAFNVQCFRDFPFNKTHSMQGMHANEGEREGATCLHEYSVLHREMKYVLFESIPFSPSQSEKQVKFHFLTWDFSVDSLHLGVLS